MLHGTKKTIVHGSKSNARDLASPYFKMSNDVGEPSDRVDMLRAPIVLPVPTGKAKRSYKLGGTRVQSATASVKKGASQECHPDGAASHRAPPPIYLPRHPSTFSSTGRGQPLRRRDTYDET
eukprot:GHVH01002060.1.p2 GENE.GHVH01002060.1~~GHVH01002060.1.p2  ORF type:complete len:122 (+),score=10.83 GHVH01002060.1:106-471(+)